MSWYTNDNPVVVAMRRAGLPIEKHGTEYVAVPTWVSDFCYAVSAADLAPDIPALLRLGPESSEVKRWLALAALRGRR